METGDRLVTYVYLDPVNPPSEIMLQWNDGTWQHRAYWGPNNIAWGTDGTVSRRSMGPLPPAGQWVRLVLPASLVGLVGSTLNGMAFTMYAGRATWDHAGKSTNVIPPILTVDVVDLMFVVRDWGVGKHPSANLNGDSVVDIYDLVEVATNFAP